MNSLDLVVFIICYIYRCQFGEVPLKTFIYPYFNTQHMEQKKGQSGPNLQKYIRKINNKESAADLSTILKEFFKEILRIKYEYTFDEIIGIISKKRIPPEMKEKITVVCEKIQTLEYRPTKPSPSEINSLKNMMKDIIKSFIPHKKKKTNLLDLLQAPIQLILDHTKSRQKKIPSDHKKNVPTRKSKSAKPLKKPKASPIKENFRNDILKHCLPISSDVL